MMDGMPVSVSTAKVISFTSLPAFAYSLRYIAAPTPSGSTITIETMIIYSVLSMLGSMPTVSVMYERSEVSISSDSSGRPRSSI